MKSATRAGLLEGSCRDVSCVGAPLLTTKLLPLLCASAAQQDSKRPKVLDVQRVFLLGDIHKVPVRGSEKFGPRAAALGLLWQFGTRWSRWPCVLGLHMQLVHSPSVFKQPRLMMLVVPHVVVASNLAI